MKVLRKYLIEEANLIAQKLDYPVVIISEDDDPEDSLQYKYLIFESNKLSGKTSIDGIEKILGTYPEALKLYYDGIQFYTIIKN